MFYPNGTWKSLTSSLALQISCCQIYILSFQFFESFGIYLEELTYSHQKFRLSRYFSYHRHQHSFHEFNFLIPIRPRDKHNYFTAMPKHITLIHLDAYIITYFVCTFKIVNIMFEFANIPVTYVGLCTYFFFYLTEMNSTKAKLENFLDLV